MIAAPLYYQIILETLASVWESQQPSLETAAGWIADALASDRCLYLFGTGHSHLLSLELFYRAGGLAQAAPILEESLMLHESASGSSEREREEGFAARILQRYPVAPGDVLLVASNSGRNAVPIEMTLEAKARGLKTIALTSLTHSRSVLSRHTSGARLFEVADLSLDNGAVVGDASVTLPGTEACMGPTSTIIGSFLVNALALEAATLAIQRGWTPAIYTSANGDGGDRNAELLCRFRDRLPHL